ncbi:dihydrofolate reductase family protein [Ornithinimicrobium cerasi]|uniref:dihydrofolate reductase family protein n=1 Tax=Ornithinimicrobium cerasi TaxID=2248773 RepID=UPI0013796EE8|nr:dihydrofolate reductase family protein [Ornithinimicrobium cerasi]
MSDDAGVTRTGTGPLTPDELADWYAAPPDLGSRPWVRAGFITTLDGRTTGPDGRSGTLNAGSDGDHAAFDHLRAWADVVVVGAGTVRAEGYRPLRGTALAVVSSGEVLPETLRGPAGPDAGEVVLVSGHGRTLGAREALDAVLAHGWRRVVVEGGASLLASWLAEGVVDELCVTVRPVLAGGAGPLLVPPSLTFADLRGTPTHLLLWGGDVLVRTVLR